MYYIILRPIKLSNTIFCCCLLKRALAVSPKRALAVSPKRALAVSPKRLMILRVCVGVRACVCACERERVHTSVRPCVRAHCKDAADLLKNYVNGPRKLPDADAKIIAQRWMDKKPEMPPNLAVRI